MFVPDINVVSELRKVSSGKANPGVADWASSVPSGQMFLSAITIHELVPNSAPLRDALIGATAQVHRMIVITRNAKDFERFEHLPIINPWR